MSVAPLYTNLSFLAMHNIDYEPKNKCLHYIGQETYPDGKITHLDQHGGCLNIEHIPTLAHITPNTWDTLIKNPTQSCIVCFPHDPVNMDLRSILIKDNTYHYAVATICILYMHNEHYLVINTRTNGFIHIPLKNIPQLKNIPINDINNTSFIGGQKILFIEEYDVVINLNKLIEQHTGRTPTYLPPNPM